MLWNYALKFFVNQLIELKVDDDGIIRMENFSVATIDITKNSITDAAAQYMS